MTPHRLAAIVVAAALAGCQTMPQQQASAPANGGCKPLGGNANSGGNSNTQNAMIGAAIGGVVGGLVGKSSAKKSSVGTRNGLLLGALTGALVGSKYNAMIGKTEQPDGSVKLDIPGSVMFRTGSAQISPEFASTLNAVGGTIKEYCGVTGTIVGHTDSTGSAALNKRLSLDRARSVADYLVAQGISPSRLSRDGRGPDEPVASNATEAGRAQNRRVEIFVRPPAP